MMSTSSVHRGSMQMQNAHIHWHMRICSASTHYPGAPLSPSDSLIYQNQNLFFFQPHSRKQKSCPLGTSKAVRDAKCHPRCIHGLKTDLLHSLLLLLLQCDGWMARPNTSCTWRTIIELVAALPPSAKSALFHHLLLFLESMLYPVGLRRRRMNRKHIR